MSSFLRTLKASESKRSSALVITLVVLVLVTLLVVSLSSMISLERSSTHESFENQRARALSNIAVDEVVALLRDSIPAGSMWAAAPGKIEYFATPTSTSTTTVALHSGQATGTASSTGQVDLNAPVLGASISTYPIISTNAEYPAQTPMPMGWIEVLQDGTMVRPGAASHADKNNPVVGRYAYWVDTETGKVNLNTAGKGQATYTFNGGTFATNTANNDAQNLTGSPSRVDLSQLDGSITSLQSLAAYHYTYGGYWLPTGAGDYLGAPVYSPNSWPAVPTNGPGSAAQGMKRFASIQQWPQLTADPIKGGAVTPVTAAQVEQNKFYLTTRSNAPEVTPWGFNKLWLQSSPVNPITNFWWSTYGNKRNGKGVPDYPLTVAGAQSNAPPGSGIARGFGSEVGDTRYYITPFIPPNYLAPSVTTVDLSFAGGYIKGNTKAEAFINAMMVQLNRTDWPGFNGQSFVGKYGQAECEDLCFNILCLYDSAIHSGGHAPLIFTGPPTNAATDKNGYYGSSSLYKIDGKIRLLSGVGEWPYFNQLSATFAPAGNTGVTISAANASPYSCNFTNIYSGKTNIYNTKINSSANGNSIGFVPAWTVPTPATATPVNVSITPSAQLAYPSGFKNPYVFGTSAKTFGKAYLVDVAVYAAGTYKGASITYGSTTAVDSEPGPPTNSLKHPYYWSLLDDYNSAATNSGGGIAPIGSSFNGIVSSSSTTPGYLTVTFPKVYIGPFDQNSVITDIQFRCRFVLDRSNIRTFACPIEIAPLAYNACPTSSGANQDALYTNVMSGTAPTFLFDTDDAGGPFVTGGTAASGTSESVTYEVADPRVYRYLSDWTKRSGAIQTGKSSIYTASTPHTDGLTGVRGDDSKLAWPDVGGGYFTSGLSAYTSTTGISGDSRMMQTANNIVGFPGIGWLSVLPLNCESSRGLVSAGTGSGDPAQPGKPVPWRTLSLEPTPASNGLQTGGKLPDWLLLEAFALAYDQTYCSQTEGKINVNAAISPQFPSGTTIPARTKPLQALIAPASYPTSSTTDLPALTASTIATDIAKGISGSTYTSPYGSSLPTDILMYPGQLCQFTSMAGTGTTQWQRESLMRSLAGVVTTQCSDFKVHVVAQAVKQVAFNGNPISDFVVTGEQRMSALVSRATNLGPDNLPDTGDEPVNPTLVTPASVTVSSGIQASLTNGTPSFKYVISDINYVNN